MEVCIGTSFGAEFCYLASRPEPSIPTHCLPRTEITQAVMNSLLLLTIMVALVPPSFCFICRYSTCEEELAEQPCPEVTEANCEGRIHHNASMCLNCCDVCFTILAPGQICSGYNWHNYVFTECEDGYFCDHTDTKVCRPISEANFK
ncbi:hypothetical protein BsWGS_25440 [Bradybaena similaris]